MPRIGSAEGSTKTFPARGRFAGNWSGNSAGCAATASKGLARTRRKSNYPDEQLDYRNLLAACRKGEGWPRGGFCEAHKGDRVLSRNPADANHGLEESIHYGNDGSIRSSDTPLDAEINSVLNLNHPALVNRRIGELEAFKKGLQKRRLNPVVMTRMIEDWNEGTPGSDLKPFCMVIVYWLRKRLARP